MTTPIDEYMTLPGSAVAVIRDSLTAEGYAGRPLDGMGQVHAHAVGAAINSALACYHADQISALPRFIAKTETRKRENGDKVQHVLCVYANDRLIWTT